MVIPVDKLKEGGNPELFALETDLLLEGLYQFYGDDLRGHDRMSLMPKLAVFVRRQKMQTISALQGQVLRDKALRDTLLLSLCGQETALFEHPEQFAALREIAGPLLRSYAMPKVWLPECTSAAEVFSIAILLAELKLHDKTQLFATASCEAVLNAVKEGSFPLGYLAQYEENYRCGGGSENLSAYWVRSGERGRFSDTLRDNITWAQCSVATDFSFNEFQLIVCRKPMWNFGMALKRRALGLFNDSLAHYGVLMLDAEFDVEHVMPLSRHYKTLASGSGFYRRAGF